MLEVVTVVVRVDVAPELLRWAVRRAGWDDETVGRRVPDFFAWVAGEKRPTLKQLEKFAHATHAPFGLLFLPEPPHEEMPIPDMRTMGNAEISQPSVDLLDTIYECQRRQEWYREYALLNGFDEVTFVASSSVDASPIEVAGQIRQALGVESDGASPRMSGVQGFRLLIDRIEAMGVLVMVNGVVGSNTHRKLDPAEFRGFALADPLAPLVFVNGADTEAAKAFTLIHELAHIWLGGSALSDADMTAKNGRAEELWCNQVAAEVLVPLTSVIADFRGVVSADELERLAGRYHVSTLVVLKRLYDAELLSWDHYSRAYEEEKQRIMSILSSKRSAGGGNFYNTQPLRLSRSFSRAVISSALEGSTTYREAFQLLGTKKRATFDNLAETVGVA